MSILFTPGEIGPVLVKNRFVRSATVECLCDEENQITARYLRLYSALARGGIGLIIPGNFFVNATGRVVERTPVLDRDEVIDDLRRLTDTVHEHDARIVAQINHGGRQSNPTIINGRPIGPSPVRDRLTGVVPRGMSAKEITDTANAFATAASRVKAAGFDGVQLNGGHGYLINQFLSSYTNRRKDEYGGELANRMRFLLEIYSAVRTAVGDEYPVMIKINGEDGLPGGFTLSECITVCKELAARGINAIEVSGGIKETGFVTTCGDIPGDLISKDLPYFKRPLFRAFIEPKLRRAARFTEGYFLRHASAIKRNVDIPVIAVGGLRRISTMEHVLNSGQADFVAMSRPFIRQPRLVKIVQERPNEEPILCTNCNRCTYEVAVKSGPLRCYYQKPLNATS